MELSEIAVGVAGVVFSVGISVGTVRQFLKEYKKKVDDLEEKIIEVSNYDKVIRNYLYGADSMPYFVPTPMCVQSHAKTDRQLEALNAKFDELLKELRLK